MFDFKRLLKLYLGGQLFCAVDTETTGLLCGTDRIIEIGAVKFSKDGILGTFSELVNPQVHIPEICTQITHITQEMLEHSPPFKTIAEPFLAFSDQTIIVAHNAQFDLRFINRELELLNMPPLANKAIDTLKLSRWAYPKNKKWTLQYLAAQHNIEVKSAHRAEDDARVCKELFIKCLEDTKDLQKKSRICSHSF